MRHMSCCRVYLIGGASAKGDESDAVVVYTPAVLGTQESRAGVIFILNVTLPHGTFYNDPYADMMMEKAGEATPACILPFPPRASTRAG